MMIIIVIFIIHMNNNDLKRYIPNLFLVVFLFYSF